MTKPTPEEIEKINKNLRENESKQAALPRWQHDMKTSRVHDDPVAAVWDLVIRAGDLGSGGWEMINYTVQFVATETVTGWIANAIFKRQWFM
jgi:hypothetical protein